MFTKKLNKLLMNSKSWTLVKRLDPALTCTSHQNCINYFQQSCKYLLTTSMGHENVVPSKQDILNIDYLPFNAARKVLLKSEICTNNLGSSLTLRDDLEIDDINQFLMKPWISMTNAELLENFELLSNYAKKNEKNLMSLEFDSIIEVIQNRCSVFSDDELSHLLKCLELWIINKEDKKFVKFWKYIDNECLNRFLSWSIDKVLLFNDQFYRLKLARISDFTYHSLKKMGYKPEKFSLSNLIHFAFLINVNRNLKTLNLYNHEYYIEGQIDKLSLDELGLFASAIVLYQSSIRSNIFLKKTIHKLKKDIDVVSDFALSKILQVLRLTADKELESEFISLLELLETQTSKRSLLILSQFAELQTRVLLHNPNLIEQILDRFEKNLKNTTIKHFERSAGALNKFQYDPKDCKFYSMIMNELLSPDRTAEINKFPKSFLHIVTYLVQSNFYSEEALKIVLDPEFIEKVSNGNKYSLHKEYLFIDYCIELEYPEYSGPRLEKDLLQFLMKKFGSLCAEKLKRNNNQTRADKMVEEVIHTCKQAFNSESAVFADKLLPQFPRSDLVICKDPNGNIIPPKDKLSQITTGTIKYAPKDGNKWYVLIVPLRTNVIRTNCKPTGTFAMQLRHLKLIGYTPIVIPCDEWQTLAEDKRQTYIKEILSR